MKYIVLESFHTKRMELIRSYNSDIKELLNCGSYTDAEVTDRQANCAMQFYRDIRQQAIVLHSALVERLGQEQCECAPHDAGIQLELRYPNNQKSSPSYDDRRVRFQSLVFRTFVSMSRVSEAGGCKWHGMDVQPISSADKEAGDDFDGQISASVLASSVAASGDEEDKNHTDEKE